MCGSDAIDYWGGVDCYEGCSGFLDGCWESVSGEEDDSVAGGGEGSGESVSGVGERIGRFDGGQCRVCTFDLWMHW